ncbi:MAG: 50S ribosomal protein L29 [Nannocystaceae bacterium]|nr:50S ribosomal protein L29 [Nannocystaceae bacterium]
MKASEIRDKTDDELVDLEKSLRDQLIRIEVAKATQRTTNTTQSRDIKRDIARIKTIAQERHLGLADGAPAVAEGAKEG